MTIRVFFSLTASKKLRDYVSKERSKAIDGDPLFVINNAERKKEFRKRYGRAYRTEDLDKLPNDTRLTPNSLAINFRNATLSMGIYIPSRQQSPLRPKRLRKVFESACTHAGIDHDLRDLFMGHSGNQSKTYQGKSREELEFYYEMVEPKITIQVDEESDELDRLHEELKKSQETKSDRIDELERSQKETANRVDMISEQIIDNLGKEMDKNKKLSNDDLMLYAKMVRLEMQTSPEYAKYFKLFVDDMGDVSPEFKKKIKEI